MTIPPPDPALVARFRRDVDALTGPEPGPFGVAVSGGADSLALLLLAWAAYAGSPSPLRRQGRMSGSASGVDGSESHGLLPAQGRRQVRAISIDHGLRAEAADECRFVGEVCAWLGVAHDIVRVIVHRSGDGLQADARLARDMAFGGWCQEHRIPWLATAHHADDQAETLLMRLARGSGVGGLAGIQRKRPLAAMPLGASACTLLLDASLLRPLLGWRRAELAGIVADAELTPVADPSNEDGRFDRTHARRLLRENGFLDASRLAAVADHCRDAEDALGFTAFKISRTALRRLEGGIELDAAELGRWPREITRRIAKDAFALLGVYPEPRGTQLMRLIGLLHAGRTATLAGIKATPRDGVWTFAKAPPRRSH